MKRNLVLTLLFLLLPRVGFSIQESKEMTDYKTASDYFDAGNYEDSRKIFEKLITNPYLPDDAKNYSFIALAQIQIKTQNDYSGAVSILSNRAKKMAGDNVSQKDILLTLSRLYRISTHKNYFLSFRVAQRCFDLMPNDFSVRLNYVLAGLVYSGFLRAHDQNKIKIANDLLADCEKRASGLTAETVSEEDKAQVFNTLGRIQNLEGKFDESATSFRAAIKYDEQPVFHRNLGWALFGGMIKGKKGRDYFNLLCEALGEFKVAISGGDKDSATMKQVPNMEAQLKKMSKKYGPCASLKNEL